MDLVFPGRLIMNFPSEMRTFSRNQVSIHNKRGDAWIIIDSLVYDISKFALIHPGGELLLLDYAGQDCTVDFFGLHRKDILEKYSRLIIGKIEGEESKISVEEASRSCLSRVPYAEPNYLQGFCSLYYSPSHSKFRLELRKFYADLIKKLDINDKQQVPLETSREFLVEMGKAGLIAATLGPGKHLQGQNILGGIRLDEFDYFHEMILHEEHSRAVFGTAFEKGLLGGTVIGAPPIFNFGTVEQQKRILPPILRGEKTIVLAISEPFAGSDVASIRATAKKTPDGKHYIVNGVKKWITGGPYADYFVVAVRTGPGKYDLTMLLVEREQGVETKPILTSAGTDTAYVTFENVKVPVENIIGKEGRGFQVIMYNFNHERWVMVVGTVAVSRLVTEECFKWANQREIFGKSLIEQAVIRNKLAHMISEIESIHAWTEQITLQMNRMSYAEQAKNLAGPIALAKLRSTRVAHYIADEACQIFGGRGITKTGMGSLVEKFQRTYKFQAILGGSEEILADLGVRQAMKVFPENAKL